jgi:predicted metal-dependent peptidase
MAKIKIDIDKTRSGAGMFPKVKLSTTEQYQWTVTRTATLLHAPAFSHMLYTMMNPTKGEHIALFTKAVPIAATDGINLVLNPKEFFKFSVSERVFVVCHEILHCIWDHCAMAYTHKRRGHITYPDGKTLKFIPELMNMAQDYVINAVLVESKVGTMPKVGLFDTKIATANDSPIDIYRKLYEEFEGQFGSGNEGNGGKDGFDQHLDPGAAGEGDKTPDQAMSDRSEIEWHMEIASAIASAKAQGKLPKCLERIFGEIVEPIVPWQDYIRGWLARKIGSGGYDWHRVDRRMISRPRDMIVAPGRSGYGCGTIVVGADTSGSIGAKTVDMFLGEVRGMLEALRPRKLYIMWCDVMVHRVDELEDASDIYTVRCNGAPGGGGTSFMPVFKEITNRGLEPDALIYLTDMYGDFPSLQPSYPVLWGSISKNVPAPFGEVVEIPDQD